MPNRVAKVAARNRQQMSAAVARRRQVAQLRLAGWRDYEQIGRQLGVSGRTIQRDFVWLDEQYRAAATADTAVLKGQQQERLEDAITGVWNDVRQGRWGAINVLLGLLERQAKLMGLDAPTRIKVDIEAEVRQIAQDEGLDEDELVRIAQGIIAGKD